jgi:hypothetical protein
LGIARMFLMFGERVYASTQTTAIASADTLPR